MARKRTIEDLYRIIGASTDYSLICEFLELMANELTDVRTNVGANDSLELRKALGDYMRERLAKIKRIRNNTTNSSDGEENDDV